MVISMLNAVGLLFFTACIFYLLPRHVWWCQLLIIAIWLTGIILLITVNPNIDQKLIPSQISIT